MRWLVLIAVGCYSPKYRDCEITCTATCPSGLVCSAGYCVASATTQCNVMPDTGVATGPWSAATPVPITPPTGLDDPSSTADGLQLFFDRGSSEIAFATRATPTSSWGPIQTAPGIAASPLDGGVATDGGPEISADGMTLYFMSNRGGTYDIWVATRDGGGNWTNLLAVTSVNSSSSDGAPSVTPDGLTMVFNSTRSGAGDIYMASRLSTTVAWSDVHPITEINGTSSEEDSPHLSADKLRIYFHSSRSGTKQLYFAERSQPIGAFGSVQPISELVDANLEEVDPWVSPDGRHLYFAGYMAGGGYTLYEASR